MKLCKRCNKNQRYPRKTLCLPCLGVKKRERRQAAGLPTQQPKQTELDKLVIEFEALQD